MLIVGCIVPALMAFTIWMANPTGLATTVVASMVWGFACGTPLVATPVLASRKYEVTKLGSVLGMLYVGFAFLLRWVHIDSTTHIDSTRFSQISFGPGQMFGPALSGLIVDSNTTYDAAGNRIGAD
jgi:mannose/fructose/N-acetylgalactosamine-specific phosphotransferase system component IID